MAILTRRLCAAAFAYFVTMASVTGSAPVATEYEVKAAFLCSFAEFVDWPPGLADRGVTIGILGRDPFGQILEATVKNRMIQNRPLIIRRLSGLEEAPRCQILFVSDSEKHDLDMIFRTLGSASILTVSDIPRFAERGGVIGFTLEEQRVRFQINVGTAERINLRISSRLLKLARIVGPASTDRG